jgi:hypothetical protein
MEIAGIPLLVTSIVLARHVSAFKEADRSAYSSSYRDGLEHSDGGRSRAEPSGYVRPADIEKLGIQCRTDNFFAAGGWRNHEPEHRMAGMVLSNSMRES